jgi:hypothetical protein
MRTVRSGIAGLACSLALTGCATRREQTSAITVASMLVEPERQPESGPSYYPPRLVRDLTGIDAMTGEPMFVERGHVLHRIDLKKVRVLDARAPRCGQDRSVCEQRVASMAASSDFWDGPGGRVLLIGLGFLAGMGVTAGLAIALE